MRWVPCELHVHTRHSDGAFSPREIAAAAAAQGLECIAITDHNSVSAWPEIEDAAAEAGIAVIRAMELTTFYGHITALGIDRYVEWRDLGAGDADKAIRAIHEAGGLAMVAHPYRPGTPFCTGCFFEFDPVDWDAVDGIEVWSEVFPTTRGYNRRSMTLWVAQANAGRRIAAVYGRDWHGPSESSPGGLPARGAAVTYVGVEDGPAAEAVLEGLRRGRTCVALGPRVSLRADRAAGGSYGPGDGAAAAEFPLPGLRAEIDFLPLAGRGKKPEGQLRVALESSAGIVEEREVPAPDRTGIAVVRFEARPRPTPWLRATLTGTVDGLSGPIAFSAPLWGNAPPTI